MEIIYSNSLPDTKKYFELFVSTGWNEKFRITPAELESAVSKSYFTVSAYDGEFLAGFGRIVSDGIIHAMIYEMIIHPDYQRKGIGTEILNRLIQKCKEDKIRDIQLFCAQGKKEFYEKHGFISRPDDAPGMQYQLK
jgi:GNAT superfamily N-acetyltransferase